VPILSAESSASFWRSLHALSITRILIASVLVLFGGFRINSTYWFDGGLSYRWLCLAYLLLALVFAFFALYRRRHFMLQLLLQIVTDIILISLLYMVAGGMKSGLAILYLFPLASAAILVPLMLALCFASVVSIFLLLQSWFLLIRMEPEVPIMQAGLYGAAFLSAVFVVNRMAAKLISQESLAVRRGHALEMQRAISQLVIDDMDDGVIVVGGDSTVYASNPSAVRKLGIVLEAGSGTSKLSDVPALKPLADAFSAWHEHVDTGSAGFGATAYVMLKPADELAEQDGQIEPLQASSLAVHLRARFVRVNAETLREDRSVIFLQDIAQIENQAQQLKLASMGRLTASIAHEVRNPLSAIAHASALLGEETDNPSQVRLLKIIADNVARMNRMVEDILNLSRKVQSQEMIGLADFLSELKASFSETHGLSGDMIVLSVSDEQQIRFDPLHLREIVLNLLGNALRYASGKPGSIRMFTVPATASRLELHVQDDGTSISPDVRAHLFEPFYTTSSKGTGLGLYLARELCLNNSAMLDYEFHPDVTADGVATTSGRFVISFAVQDR